MLFFALLLQSAPTMGEELSVALRLVDPASEREEMRDRRYRLDVEPAPIEDAKDRALRSVWKPCGLTGAPVCPSQGRLTVRASFEPPG